MLSFDKDSILPHNLRECTSDAVSPFQGTILQLIPPLTYRYKISIRLKNLGGTQAEQNRLATGAVDFSKDPKKANLFIVRPRVLCVSVF